MAENKVKEHFKKYGKLYLGVGIGVVVGGVAVACSSKTIRQSLKGFVFVKGDNHGVIYNNVVVTELERRGHPGNIVKCLETGEVFASQNRAADVLGVSPISIRRQLNGMIENAKGYHFELLGEAQ